MPMISFKPFREIVEERKITTYFLRNKCGEYNLDNKTIDRLMNDESVSTHTVDALCNILKCGLSDIMEFIPDEDNGD
jgi:DNA-binding Xre family transcriptional regulator